MTNLKWLGLGAQALMLTMRACNFGMQQMMLMAAGRVLVSPPMISVSYGCYDGQWGWRACVTREGRLNVLGPVSADPVHAVGALVDRIEHGGDDVP